MAIGGFLALLDDVAAMMGKVAATAGDDIAAASKVVLSSVDEVATMTKAASQQASALITDDIALNANAVTGVDPKREYPIVLKIWRGSLMNKPVLVPLVVGLNALCPVMLGPLLIMGGCYLAYEGSEKVYHALIHHHGPHSENDILRARTAQEYEQKLVTGAVRTDWVMSAEILTIGLSTMTEHGWGYQLIALSILGIGMSTLIYPVLVGSLVKADDWGKHLAEDKDGSIHQHALGRVIVRAMPKVMKGISFIGTVAMFVVGGELIAHNIPFLHHGVEGIEHAVTGALSSVPSIAGITGDIVSLITASLIGGMCGGALVKIVPLIAMLRKRLIRPI